MASLKHPTDHSSAQGGLVRAAQYVRMSTEHQRYSTENQSDAIAQYAAQRGITIVRTYADHGKSGLRLGGRDALQQLIGDVRSGRSDFAAILVYDVSRWGRFQDADESAYYEYVCKEAGLSVHYCAEQFENDGSLSATIIKGMKRAMAGEYSRELSAKVFAGQCRLIRLGFRQGGIAGYGLRRQLLDEQRHPKGELTAGMRKSLQTDRVVLIPGPIDEVETVNRIYRMFVDQGLAPRQIADTLNREGLTCHTGRPWTSNAVDGVLTNEKYAGHNVYNHTSFKLKRTRVTNPPEMWVRADQAFSPIVETGLFESAQQSRLDRTRRLSNEEMLTQLETLRTEVGSLSGVTIDESPHVPSSAAFRSRFGGLLRAYTLIGYTPARDYAFIEVNRQLRQQYGHIVTSAMHAIERLGGTVQRSSPNDLLRVNNEFTASLVVGRCYHTPAGGRRWSVRFDVSPRPDITVALRMDVDNRDVLDYFVFPTIDIQAPRLRLREDNGLSLDAFRYDTLDAFLHLTARAPIRTAA